MKSESLIPTEYIENRILLIRGEKIIIDTHLASIYGVSTKALLQATKRNIDRFPEDFMFQLTAKEKKDLKSHFRSEDWGGRRYLPYAFTEHGAIMAASILRSKRAVKASIYVVRAFVKMKQIISSHKDLAEKIDELERNVVTHDKAIVSLFDAIRKMMAAPEPKKRKIGFIQDD
jgi:hypothetical protein